MEVSDLSDEGVSASTFEVGLVSKSRLSSIAQADTLERHDGSYTVAIVPSSHVRRSEDVPRETSGILTPCCIKLEREAWRDGGVLGAGSFTALGEDVPLREALKGRSLRAGAANDEVKELRRCGRMRSSKRFDDMVE